MEEVSTVSAGSPESVGGTLRGLRERAGLSLADTQSDRLRVKLRVADRRPTAMFAQ